MVDTEVEWDDLQRALIEGLEEFERGVCDGCGFHTSLTDIVAHDFDIKHRVCALCAHRDRHERKLAHADDVERGEAPKPGRRDPADGRKVYIVYKGKAKAVQPTT